MGGEGMWREGGGEKRREGESKREGEGNKNPLRKGLVTGLYYTIDVLFCKQCRVQQAA